MVIFEKINQIGFQKSPEIKKKSLIISSSMITFIFWNMNFIKKIKSKITKIKKGAEALNALKNFATQIKPVGDFQKDNLPQAPDYSNVDSWAAHPDKESKSSFVPEGIAPATADDLKADVFFIHPTSYFGQTWNAALDHAFASEMIDEMIMPGQASVFNSCCQIYAPRYRQATFYSFLYPNENSRRALELGYEDVATAFDFFIKNRNPERPFFIGSHSQGTCHAIRLLEEKIENTSLLEKMVAAYTIGFQFPKEKFGTVFQNLHPSKNSTDTQCVIAYDTYVESGKLMSKIERTENWFSTPDGKGEWRKRNTSAPLGINPLSWTAEKEKIAANKNLGAVISNMKNRKAGIKWENFASDTKIGLNTLGLSAPFKGEVSAEVKADGFLHISKPEHRVFSGMLLPGGNYHNYDYALFYMNLRVNVKERLEVFMQKES